MTDEVTAARSSVSVRLPGALRASADGNKCIDLPVEGEVALAALLDALDARHPALARRIRDEQGRLRRYVNVYIDGLDAREHDDPIRAPVRPGAEVLVLPSVAGG
jgi:molybdopterin converting factor small subunit